jgi:small-conductance mechanosensitive channel
VSADPLVATATSHCPIDTTVWSGLCTFLEDHTSNEVAGVLTSLLEALTVVVVVLVVGRLVRRTADRALERSRADRQVQTLIHNLLAVATLAVAVLGGLSALGVSLGVLITSLGLTGLAVGLALQDLLRNILAGIFLLIERPFRIGDLITVGDLNGTVETIELRTTAIRTLDGRLAIMPNLNAFNGTVINSSAFDRRRYTVSLWVPQGIDLESVLRAVRTELESTESIAAEPAPRVVPKLDIDGGVTLQVMYWLDYRSVDPDAVAADLVRRLFAETGSLGLPSNATG